MIVVEFADKVTIEEAKQKIKDKVDNVKSRYRLAKSRQRK
jgi:hypothetical protein